MKFLFLSLLLLAVLLGAALGGAWWLDASLQAQRAREDSLRLSLAEIRAALDLAAQAGSGLATAPVPALLTALSERGFLRAPLGEPLGAGWAAVDNFLANPSFEDVAAAASPAVVPAWTITGSGSAVLSADDWPGRSSAAFDHYPGQNLLGARLASGGHSLRLEAAGGPVTVGQEVLFLPPGPMLQASLWWRGGPAELVVVGDAAAPPVPLALPAGPEWRRASLAVARGSGPWRVAVRLAAGEVWLDGLQLALDPPWPDRPLPFAAPFTLRSGSPAPALTAGVPFAAW